MSVVREQLAAGGQRYPWTVDRYVAAWEAGVFGDDRVELIEGDIYRMAPVGPWHQRSEARIIRGLPGDGVEILAAGSQPIGEHSMPEPGVSVLRGDAVPVRGIGSRISQWSPDDVLLVVEVSDSTVHRDLEERNLVYAAAAFATYWVVTRDAVHVLTEPGPDGYGRRETFRRGDQVPVAYAPGVTLAVEDLLG